MAANTSVPKVVVQLQNMDQWKEPTAEQEAPLLAFVPQVVAKLQENGLWEGVRAEEVALHVVKASFGTLTPPLDSGASPVILKLMVRDLTLHHPFKSWGKQQTELAVACHMAWSDAGLAPPVLARTDEFLIEPLGELRAGGMWALENFVGNGVLAAKLHAAPTDWFTDHFRDMLQEVVPLLKEEPLGSALFPIAAGCLCRGATKETLPPTEQVRTLMALLPRPFGEHAERVVNVHGDLWYTNVVHMVGGEAVFVDFEQSCVSSAVQDLREFSHLATTEAYLRAATGAKPSERELYALHLEACIASTVSGWLRDCFWFAGGLEKVEMIIARAPAFTALCVELRLDHALNKAAMDLEDHFSGLDCVAYDSDGGDDDNNDVVDDGLVSAKTEGGDK
mmetsp:Transcript_24933/g.45588  ORF Transcript_24933/g.45588 Transcript_24933/m.45588 type:complete len:393 (+) Transcript_24933:36-1214(+)